MAGMMGVNMAMGQCATRSTSYQTVLSWLPGEINTHGRSKDIKIGFLLSNFEIINLKSGCNSNFSFFRNNDHAGIDNQNILAMCVFTWQNSLPFVAEEIRYDKFCPVNLFPYVQYYKKCDTYF